MSVMFRRAATIVVLPCLLAVIAVHSGTFETIVTKTCDGGEVVRIVANPDPVGPQLASLAHMIPTDSGIALGIDRQFMEIESTRVELRVDTLLTAFYQTHPATRSLLGPADTWIAFSADRLVPMDGATKFGFSFKHGQGYTGSMSDTRYVQFALIPPAYADTLSLADSVALHMRFQLSDGSASGLNRLVSNTFVPQDSGRYVGSSRLIPSSPAGAGYSGPFYLPKAGDLVISEIMADPNSGVADATGEWFEVTNTSDVYLNIDAVSVRDQSGEYFRNSRGLLDEGNPNLLPPGGIAVFGRVDDARINGGYRAHVCTRKQITLANSSDAIILEVDGVGIIDRVDYSSAWNIPSGKSIELIDLNTDNNVSTNWAQASQVYGNKGQKGTPGAAYNVDTVDPSIGDTGDAPTAGSLVITELHTAPWEEDASGEWFEICNPTDRPINLTDLVVETFQETGSVASFRIVDELIINPRSYLVFTREDVVAKGGLPMGYAYKGSFSLHNDRATLRLSFDTLVIDEVSYNGAHFAGFPDYGDNIMGSWPMSSEYDGRTTALQASLEDLRNPSFDNNDPSHWAQSERWRLCPFGTVLYGTPGEPNTEEAALTLAGTPSTLNTLSFDTFRLTITPPAGYTVSDIDTQSIRLFARQRPIYLTINASTITADFRYADVPYTMARNIAATATLTARGLGDTPIRFGGSWSMTPEDTSRPVPATVTLPSPGDLKIVEIMVNAAGAEEDHEYIELLNLTSDKTFDLRDLGVQDGGGSTSDATPEGRTRIYNRGDGASILLGPGERAAIGRNHSSRFLGFTSRGSMLNQDLNFANSGDQVVVFRLTDGVAVAEVDYEPAAAGFPDQNSSTADGRSMALIETGLDASKGANWINSSIPFRLLTDTSYGTPGKENRVASRAGSLVVTEVYADPPPGGEPNAEFFEVWNPDTAHPVDLAGLTIQDDAGNSFTVSDRPGLTVSGGSQRSYIPPGGVFVFGNSRGASDGVDATFSDTYGAQITRYDYANTWTFLNSSDAVRIVRHRFGDSTVIAGMSYTATTAGKSWALSNLTDSTSWIEQVPNPTVVP